MLKDLLVNRVVKPLGNRHRPGAKSNIFLVATPRGGSTWLMEMIWSQPGFKSCNEPLDLRNPLVRKHIGARDWEELYRTDSERLLEPYFRKFVEGKLHIVDPLPLRGKYHRLRSDRIVFKLLHGAEDKISWLTERFNGQAVLLLRHPIAVSLSRKVLPRLDTFIDGDYGRHFRPEQLRLARRVRESGSRLERGVLDWCFQNAVPLRHASSDWLVVSYEQLVMEPDQVIDRLAVRLELPDVARMKGHVTQASAVTRQSDAEAKRLLSGNGDRDDRQRLIERWRSKVGRDEELRAMEILACFDIDFYSAGENVPNRKYWLQPTGKSLSSANFEPRSGDRPGGP